MKRRDFFKHSILGSGAFFVPSFLKGMEFLSEVELSGFRNLVIIQLSGGNDGLNTIVPYRNDLYYKLRPSISKSEKGILTLDNDLGINDSCKELKALYDAGELCVLNNVGYPNPNRSHFRSTDIWHAGSGSEDYLKTGWIGRYLDANCQNPYEAIEYNSGLSMLLKGERLKGIALTNPQQLYQSTREPFFQNLAKNTSEANLTEDNQGYLYKTLIETYSSAEYIHETSKIFETDISYPDTAFAKNLKGIGDLINSGLKTRVYYSSLGGFDSHVNQVSSQDRLLKVYSEAISALVQDLKKTDRYKDTLILTFSEFGRRVKENGSRGTDHGSANNLFLMGGSLKKPGIFNAGPDLSQLDENGDIQHSIDFRSVYASVLEKWLEVDSKSILFEGFADLGIV